MGMRRPRGVPAYDSVGEPRTIGQAMPLAGIAGDIAAATARPDASPAGRAQTAVWDALRRGGAMLVEDGLNRYADRRVAEATQEGQAAAARALKAGPETAQPVALRADGTLAGAAFDKAVTAAYLARLDVTGDEFASRLNAEAGADPQAWAKRWDEAGKTILATLPPEWRESAALTWRAKGMRHVERAVGVQREKALGEANAQLLQGFDHYAREALTAARSGDQDRQREAWLKAHEALQARTDLSPVQRETAILKLEDEITSQIVLGSWDQAKALGAEPAQRFIDTLAKDGGDTYGLDPDQIDRLTAEMTRDLRGIEADRTASAREIAADGERALALAQAGYAVPQIAHLVERAQLVDPALAARLAQANEDLGTIAANAKLPPPALLDRIAELKDRADAADTIDEKARLARLHEAAVKSYQAQADALDKDPLTHAERQGAVPATATPTDAASLAARIAARNRAAERYGIAVPILKPAEAAAMVRQIMAAPPEQMADLMEGQAAAYGDAWPEVFGELVAAKLPSLYRVLATMDTDAQAAARVRLAAAYNAGIDNAGIDVMKKAAGPAVREVDEALAANLTLGEFRATVAAVPQGAEIAADYADAVRLLALDYARTMTADKAVTQAVTDLTARWDFTVRDGFAARAPAGLGERMRQAADQRLRALTADDLAPSAPLGPDDPLDEAARRRAAYRAARRGTWITNPLETGWVLVDEQGQPVEAADGGLIEIPFADPRRGLPAAPVNPDGFNLPLMGQ